MSPKKLKKIIDGRAEEKNKKRKAEELPLPHETKTKQAKKKSKININENTENVEATYSNNFVVNNEPVKNQADDDCVKENADECILWPEEDLRELLNRMEACLPENDILAFNTRTEKLDWQNIAFKDYTGEECKKTWHLIQKRIRRFRILKEVLSDARDWINKPWTDFYRGGKTKRHPDMPRRPLSSYMLFYLKKKDKILAENPGMGMTAISKKVAQKYKLLSDKQRKKYTKLAVESKQEYQNKLEQFYKKHPDYPRKASHKHASENGPMKPLTPFGLYYKERLKKIKTDDDNEKNIFKEKCKAKWKNMLDKKKVLWIDQALEEEAKYLEELKSYTKQNPKLESTRLKTKPILTKEEKLIKERAAGKPTKPPNSAYSLFSRLMLQSEQIKEVDPKQRLNVIAEQWSKCSDNEKKQYKERVNHLMEQYKFDFATYLESLPEEKRMEELQNKAPKRKTGKTKPALEPVNKIEHNSESNKKKEKGKRNEHETDSSSEETVENKQMKKAAIPETDIPIKPPISAQALFIQEYKDKKSANRTWKHLSKDEKMKYESKLAKLKHHYLLYTVKSLSNEEVEALYALRVKETAKPQTNNIESDENTNSSDDSESASDSS